MKKACLFLLLCRCVVAQQSGIAGVAMDSVTHQPLAGVHVTLGTFAPSDAPPEDTYGAISGRDGRFSVSAMPPGIYFVSAQRNGYIYVPGKPPNVTVKPGEIAAFTVELAPQAVISGRIFDENGDPVQHVEVEALPSGAAEIRARAPMNARSDERGQFRLIGAPGKYYLQAAPDREPMMDFPGQAAEGSAGPVYGATYYPGTASKDRATALTVEAGREAAGIDIRLEATRTFRMSGVVTGAPAAASGAAMVWVSPAPRGHGVFIGSNGFPIGPGGKFTITGLAPGRYRVMARSEDVLTSPALQSPSVEVSLETGDATNVTLALAEGEALSGVLKIEGALAEKPTVRLEGQSQRNFGENKGVEVGADGAFRFANIFPDKYVVSVLPMPENAYIKSVSVDGVETTDGAIDLSRGVNGAKVKVTVSRNGGQVEGRVLGADGQALPTLAFVVLAAKAEEIGGEHLKPILPGEKLTFRSLRPGKYRLMVLGPDQIANNEDDIASAQALFAKAPEIEIHEGDRITKDVTVAAAEDSHAQQ